LETSLKYFDILLTRLSGILKVRASWNEQMYRASRRQMILFSVASLRLSLNIGSCFHLIY